MSSEALKGNVAYGRGPLFVYYFAYCRSPVDEVKDLLSRHADDVSLWAEGAYREGEDLVGRLRPWPGQPVATEVRMDLGRPAMVNGGFSLPLRWTAARAPRLFPELWAELSFEPFGPDVCQVTMRGSYRPPLGAVGRAIDRALLHHIAERTAKSFVDDLIVRIEAHLNWPDDQPINASDTRTAVPRPTEESICIDPPSS